jgi:hypothetical protein
MWWKVWAWVSAAAAAVAVVAGVIALTTDTAGAGSQAIRSAVVAAMTAVAAVANRRRAATSDDSQPPVAPLGIVVYAVAVAGVLCAGVVWFLVAAAVDGDRAKVGGAIALSPLAGLFTWLAWKVVQGRRRRSTAVDESADVA